MAQKSLRCNAVSLLRDLAKVVSLSLSRFAQRDICAICAPQSKCTESWRGVYSYTICLFVRLCILRCGALLSSQRVTGLTEIELERERGGPIFESCLTTTSKTTAPRRRDRLQIGHHSRSMSCQPIYNFLANFGRAHCVYCTSPRCFSTADRPIGGLWAKTNNRSTFLQ